MANLQSSFLLNADSLPISIVFDDSVLHFMKGQDLEVLRKALSAANSDANHYLKELSPEFKDCLLALGGAESAKQLDVDPSSCSISFLDMKHLVHDDKSGVKFSLRHISQLPKWTTGKLSAKGTGDRIIVKEILGPPYLQGDYMAVHPRGALDFAVSATLCDSVWINDCLCLVSQEYTWHRLYLAEKGASKVYQQCLSSTVRFGMERDSRTYDESSTKYKAAASAPFRALEEIGNQHRNNTVAIVGPNRTLLRPGMGVVVDPPLAAKAAYVESIYGSVTAVDTITCQICIRLLLGYENLPPYVIGNLGQNELLQTNAILQVPFDWVSGSFRLWPPLLFQADCIPQRTEKRPRRKFLGRIVVCDLKIHLDGEERGENEIKISFEVLSKLMNGELSMTLSRLKPFPPQAALDYIHHMHELEGGLNPPAFAYQSLMGNALMTFARKKVEHARSANKDHLSFRPNMPGSALMELIYDVVKNEERVTTVSNGNLMVEVRDLDALLPVFGLTPSRIDLRHEGHGIIDFHGPFIFKWSMYDTLEPSGPMGGSVSISVGSYTEYNRMGTDVIKSSKPHPDALRGSSLKIPKEKRARASSDDGKRRHHASVAAAQAEARLKRQMRRMEIQSGIAASGSTSESTGEELAVSRFSKGPPSSDSQSGGERQDVQSVRLGGFQVLTGEELLDVVAVEQGERRGEGQAAPA